MSQTMDGFFRISAKIYGPEPVGIPDDAEAFVPIFHEWIRARAFDAVLFDVADYAHVPDSPGIMLVSHEAAFALDRSDERFGLHAQRRVGHDVTGVDAIVRTVRLMLEVAAKLQTDPRLAGKLSFDTSTIRMESNDRLRAPNTDEGAAAFEPLVRQALEQLFPGGVGAIQRVKNDPRDRLALDVAIHAGARSGLAA